MAEGKREDLTIAPTLVDFYNEIEMQPEPEAHNLALALERFVKGTQNSFAFRTNVEINNRFTVYNIKDIGDGHGRPLAFRYVLIISGIR